MGAFFSNGNDNYICNDFSNSNDTGKSNGNGNKQ